MIQHRLEMLAWLVGALLLGWFLRHFQLGRTRRHAEALSDREARAHEAEVASLHARLEALQKGRREQESLTLELERRIRSLEDELDVATRERDEAKATLAAVAGSHEADLAELRRAQKAAEHRLVTETSEYEAAVTALRARLHQTDQRIVELESQQVEMVTLQSDLEATRVHLEAARQERDDALGRAAAAERDHESGRVGAQQAQDDALARALEDRRAAEQAALATITAMEVKLAQARQERDQQIQRHEDAMRATQVTLREQDSLLQAVRTTNERLEAELIQARQDRDASVILAQRRHAEVARIQHQTQDTDHVRVRFQRQQAELEAEVAHLQRELDVTRRRAASAPATDRAPTDELQTRGRAAQLTADLERAHEELAASRRTLTTLQAAVQQHTGLAVALEAAEQRRGDLEVEVAALRQRAGDPSALVALQSLADDRATSLSTTTQALEEAQMRVAALEADLTRSRTALREEEARRVTLEATVAHLEAAANEPEAPQEALVSESGEPYPVSIQDQIRAKAYAIWVREGQPDGRSNEIWLLAEAEVASARQA